MKNVKIMGLTVDNFKGQRHLVLDLDGRSASIYGDNGTGKTTVYDALTWLLFGKDSGGGTKFDIKPHDGAGRTLDSKAITAVEAVLEVDAAPLTLRRTYYERWSSRRGGGEVLEGHSSDFFVDGVPVKKYAFEEQVASIVDEGLFRVLTNVTWFCQGMHWRDRRAVLFQLGQVEDDRALMAERAEFAPLLAAMGRLELEDYKKKLLAERKGLSGVRDDVPVRMDECRKRLEGLEGIDFAALDRERQALLARREAAQADLARLSHGSLLEGKRCELASARLERTALEREREDYRRGQLASMQDAGELDLQLKRSEAALRRQEERLALARGDIRRAEEQLERLRERWRAVSAMAFRGEDCPTCRRPLEGAMLREAEERFRANKQQALDDILAESRQKKETLEQGESFAGQLEADIARDKERLAGQRQALEAARAAEGTIQVLPGYEERAAALEARIEQLSREAETLERDSAAAGGALRETVRELDGQLRALDGQIAKQGVLIETRRRLEELRRQGAETAARLEEVERMLDLCEQFVRYKTSRITENVNSRFQMVRWRLFEEQVNGGIAECCEATVDGTAYSTSLNKAAKVNAGMEVIDVLSRHYGVRVPLVVDDAEGVTALRKTEGQVIRLVVSGHDPVLRVEMEEKSV